MPSDDRAMSALRALARPAADFRSAVVAALEQGRAYLAGRRADAAGRSGRARVELGPFGADRIDAERFAALLETTEALEPMTQQRIERALDALSEVAARGDALFQVEVPPGGSLRDAVAGALAYSGRAFGAALAVTVARSGRYRPEEHAALMRAFPFAGWNRAERRLAAPLVVTVDGSDLHAPALAEFLDGRVKIVLVVRGACAPAPLARLITPGTLVVQTTDAAALERVAAASGPAIAALVPESAARFVHDPSAGSEPWQRLALTHTPPAPTKSLGGISAWQQTEELRQLVTLAARPTVFPPAAPADAALVGAGVADGDSTERLAAWLLSAADLRDLG